MLFVKGVPMCAWWIGFSEDDDYNPRRGNYEAPQAHLHCQRVEDNTFHLYNYP